MEQIKDFCLDCPNRQNCKAPCKPVEKWLREGQSLVFESMRGDVTVLFAQHNQVRFSEMADINPEKDRAFIVEEPEEAIPIEPQQKTAAVFYGRFFQRKSNSDLAVELDISPDEVSILYHYAKKRLLEVVEALDGRNFGIKHFQKSKTREFTKKEKWFLLSKVFGFTISEVARMPGAASEVTVRRNVNRMYEEYRERYFSGEAAA